MNHGPSSALPGTADDLVDDARRAGHTLTGRTITEWVRLGLLDRPERRSQGRGKGSAKALYSPRQRELCSLLLDKRGTTLDGKPRTASHLFVIPVGIWLYWGTEYVPTRQAKRALKSWASSRLSASETRGRANANEVIDTIAHPDTSLRRLQELRKMLAEAIAHGVRNDQQLALLVAQVVDPHGDGTRAKHPLLPLNAPTIVRAWIAETRARQALASEQVTEAQLEWAREQQLSSLAEFNALQPLLQAVAATPAQALFASPPDLQSLIEQAPHHLLLPIAALLEQERR